MQKSFILLFFILISNISYSQHHDHQVNADTTKVKPKSPRLSSMAMVGDNHVHIDYGSPSVRGRNIWNGLVSYGQVWATGAHKATCIEFGQDIIIQGKHISKGKYGFYTIPNKKSWILILNKSWDMHLADDYKSENDVIRVKVRPKKNKKITESLSYSVTAFDNKKGRVSMAWEYLTVYFDFENLKK